MHSGAQPAIFENRFPKPTLQEVGQTLGKVDLGIEIMGTGSSQGGRVLVTDEGWSPRHGRPIHKLDLGALPPGRYDRHLLERGYSDE